MSRENIELAIVFADISGSSRLYETLGDAVARELVSQCLSLMAEQIRKHHGVVIKTIGDEIMCTFPSADQAVKASMGMLEGVTEDLPSINSNTPSTMTIRVGLHHGPAILEGGDVFGDAVNVAARMASLAKGGQIITTHRTAKALSSALQASVRHLDRVSVKGKSGDIDIFEVIWKPEEVTRIATGLLKGQAKSVHLRLRYHGRELHLDQNTGTVLLGRSQKADVVVNDGLASREHARIECRRDKFILTDQSTNGTYVMTPEGVVYLRREDLTLSGQGKITLGRDLKESEEVVVYDCDS